MNKLIEEPDAWADTPGDRLIGFWIPIEFMRLHEQQVLNAEELLLLVKIHHLGKDDRGCYASNTWLAEWKNKKENTISLMISKLSRLGFVKARYVKGKQRGTVRYLKVNLEKINRYH